MAKKIVRGITDVKTINNQDFDTNNVNDLLSDGQYNYIHRKKGKTEEYHNLTDNIKTLFSDNTELLSVTNYNKTTNTATLHPKHDKQKEQVLESTRNTITIHHGENGTDEKTTVDTNPKKVLEHDKLKTGDGLGTLFNNDETTIILKPTEVRDVPAKNGFYYGNVLENDAEYCSISLNTDNNKYVQLAFRERVGSPGKIIGKYRFINNNVPTSWNDMLLDEQTIKSFLTQKQNTLISDSEYITLNQQGDNTTHIKTAALEQELQQLHQTKQDVLTAGEGITIQGNTISATDSSTSTVQYFTDTNFKAYKHRVETSEGALTTLSFKCYNAAETVLTGELKHQLEYYISPNVSISNGAISISNDGTNMKLINSAPSENVRQHATFTFYGETDAGGGTQPE